MITLNKYLRELGLNDNDYPFKKENKRDYPHNGFVEANYYDLRYTMALRIYSDLCYFKDYASKIGYPYQCGSMEKWLELLDKMIEAFKLIITVNEVELSKTQIKKIRYGLRLFTKYYFDLWT